MSKELSDSKDILIHGILEKKTFITYSYYYFIVHRDLKIIRIKQEDEEKRR